MYYQLYFPNYPRIKGIRRIARQMRNITYSLLGFRKASINSTNYYDLPSIHKDNCDGLTIVIGRIALADYNRNLVASAIAALNSGLGDDPEKDYGRHHALDIYTIVAMMTSREWEESVQLAEKYKNNSKAQEASGIVHEMFKDELSPGIIRLRESKYYKDSFQMVEFLRALKDLFKID